MKISKRKIKQLFTLGKKTLKEGKLILIQTDTVIGIAADATNTKAIEKLNVLKGAPKDKVRQIILSKVEDIYTYCDVSVDLIAVLNRLLPGPYTFILKARKNYPLSPLTTQDGKVGIRVPYAPTLLKFIEFYGQPLAATSANVSGKPPVVSYENLDPYLKEQIPVFIPEVETDLTKRFLKSPTGFYYASGIIDLTGKRPKILRKHPANAKAIKVLNTIFR